MSLESTRSLQNNQKFSYALKYTVIYTFEMDEYWYINYRIVKNERSNNRNVAMEMEPLKSNEAYFFV